MTHTGAIRPYQATAYGRNTGVIQREERGFLTVEEGVSALPGLLLAAGSRWSKSWPASRCPSRLHCQAVCTDAGHETRPRFFLGTPLARVLCAARPS